MEAGFDLLAFFAEQDRHMNIPDEDIDSYLKRLNNKNGEIASCSSKSSPEPRTLGREAEKLNSRKDSELDRPSTSTHPQPSVAEELQDVDTSNKRKVSLQLESFVNEKRRSSNDNPFVMSKKGDTGTERTSSPLAIAELSGISRELDRVEYPKVALHKEFNSSPQMDHEKSLVHSPKELQLSEPSGNRIDSFSEIMDIQSFPVSTTNVSNALKRKTPPEKSIATPAKKRSLEKRTDTHVSLEQFSPISSFETSVKTSHKAPIIIAKRGEIELLPLTEPKPTRKNKLSAAKLKPSKSSRNVNAELDPPTSPIEDPSISFSTSVLPVNEHLHTEKAVPTGGSNLTSEVKGRLVSNAAAKRRDKVVKLGTKPQKTSAGVKAPFDESDIISISPSSSPGAQPSALPNASSKITGKSKKDAPVKPVKPKTTKGKKEKEPRYTYIQYAEKLERDAERVASGVAPKKRTRTALKGKHIYYVGGDMSTASESTKRRMDVIVKDGGTIAKVYDPSSVTHIVISGPELPVGTVLKALSIRRLSDIPHRIPTVVWNWVAHSGDDEECWMYARFAERIEAGIEPQKLKGKSKAKVQSYADVSNISDFTQDRKTMQRNGTLIPGTEDEAVHSKIAYASSFQMQSSDPENAKDSEDPLAEYCAEAKAERDTWWGRVGEVEDSDDGRTDDEQAFKHIGRPPKRGWTCDKNPGKPTKCVNEDIVDKLAELKQLHESKMGDGEHWRVYSYSKCIPAIRNHPKRIQSFSEARSIRGVGEKTALKIMEIIETGKLRRIGYEKTDDVKAMRLFQGIYGVGRSTAFKLYAAGCRTLEDVKAGKGGVKLSPAQEIGVRFYDDINDRMPREEAKAIFDLIKPIALSIDPKLFIEIMGSYRRGKADCGDIDILITRLPEDRKTHSGVLSHLLQELHAHGIITEDLALPEDPEDLEAIYRGLCKLPSEGARRRRIDFLTVPWQSRGAALLYYTGDDIFNRAMRLKANKLGYSLNQRGLFGNVVRDPHDSRVKPNTGTLVASETEQEIFRVLDVPWQEPHKRVRG
ncbi:hypothetical protein BDQ12DRAFT_714349 [Crucibulum laeve]|uniref:DNA polymerase beta n=1 Tax=Crucibulum laeve TaxID=68775 RepID=A0A5C3M4R6_9AGAR|nr:hypothetical protein BDQ12DRAFT_714349 [Crucibulum laeve]